jgi:hypothetical protein
MGRHYIKVVELDHEYCIRKSKKISNATAKDLEALLRHPTRQPWVEITHKHTKV